jgi:hypothetical protein
MDILSHVMPALTGNAADHTGAWVELTDSNP